MNNIPTFNSDVISVATSSDGRFVAGTYPNIVLIIPTFSLKDASLYSRSLPKAYKPTPISLQISPEDLNEIGIDPMVSSYTPATFNVNRTTKARYVVTGIEDFVITWNFDKILRGETVDLYTVKNLLIQITAVGARMRTVQFRHDDAASFLSAGPGTIRGVKNEIIE